MPSTPLGICAGHFASFRIVKFSIFAVQADFVPGSIPGSSTEKMLVRATSSGQFFLTNSSSGTGYHRLRRGLPLPIGETLRRDADEIGDA